MKDGRVTQREGFLAALTQGADKTLALVRSLLPNGTTTFVASDHGFGAQFLAIDASKVLVDLGLLSKPQTATAARRPVRRLERPKPAGPAARCRFI